MTQRRPVRRFHKQHNRMESRVFFTFHMTDRGWSATPDDMLSYDGSPENVRSTVKTVLESLTPVVPERYSVICTLNQTQQLLHFTLPLLEAGLDESGKLKE